VIALTPARLVAAGAVVAVLAFQLWISPHNPPGFHHDEAAFALNAYTIAHHLRDQNGALLPIVLPSYGDYKTATFSYVLAPAILVLGAKDSTARIVAALFGIAAIAALGALAYRRAGPRVGLAIVVLAGLTPWLFQLGRVAYDTSMFPLATALVFLALDFWARSGRPAWVRCVAVGAALGFLTYAYGAGRLLAPLLAAALVLFARRVSWRSIAGAWLVYAVTLVPVAVYRFRHPSGLSARYHATTFVEPGMSFPRIVGRAVVNTLEDFDPWRWLVSGDRKPYVDVWGAPQLLAVGVLLAVLGVVEIARHRRGDRFWLFVLVATVLAAVPAALTVDRHDALRLSALPVCFVALAIPGVEWIAGLRRANLMFCVLAAAAVAEWAFFVSVYSDKGTIDRSTVFEVDVPALIARGLAGGRTIYVDHDDPYALTMGQWYAVSHGLLQSRVVRLRDGGVPPTGSMVLGRTQACDYTCVQLAEADSFWLARAAGPKPTG
jgi:4-amino-4-deoxy-L-arabinose transferase-like glycosyltransferase